VDAGKRLARCEGKISQALSLHAKFVRDIESVKGEAIPGDEEDAARHMGDFVRKLTIRKDVIQLFMPEIMPRALGIKIILA
jgi:hypothetical protein